MMKNRFTLEPGYWYACQFFGDFFAELGSDGYSYSPIKVHAVHPEGSGRRRFSLSFYHANYPQGVRDKAYRLEMLERGQRFLLARKLENVPVRLLYFHGITAHWVKRHFPTLRPEGDIQTWLERNV